jgi:hypothetical protein
MVIVGSYGYGRAPEDIVRRYFDVISGKGDEALSSLI